MRRRFFENLPLTVVTFNDFEKSVPPKVETRTVDWPGHLAFVMMTQPWSPVVKDRRSGKFHLAKMVALSLDGAAYSLEEALADFSNVVHIIARHYNDGGRGGFVLVLPLQEVVRSRREYETIAKKVAAKCRTQIQPGELDCWMPFCDGTVSINARAKVDVARLLLGVAPAKMKRASIPSQRVAP